MKLKIVCISLLLSITSCVFPMMCHMAWSEKEHVTFKMPAAVELEENLRASGFDHLITRTKLIQDLASKGMGAWGVVNMVNRALKEYHDRDGISLDELNEKKPVICEALLKDMSGARALVKLCLSKEKQDKEERFKK